MRWGVSDFHRILDWCIRAPVRREDFGVSSAGLPRGGWVSLWYNGATCGGVHRAIPKSWHLAGALRGDCGVHQARDRAGPSSAVLFRGRALSVIIQVLYFKRTGQTRLPDAPIHHQLTRKKLGGIHHRESAFWIILAYSGEMIGLCYVEGALNSAPRSPLRGFRGRKARLAHPLKLCR